MLSPYRQGFRVTSVQGPRWGKPHQGLDMVGVDKNIYAVKGGVAVVSSVIDKATGRAEWAFGNRVMIRDDDGKFVMYNHLARRTVTQGQRVEAGMLIGTEGCTGHCVPANGVHLHFEVRDRQGFPYTVLSAADYLGIPNAIAVYTAPESETVDDVMQKIADKAKFDFPSAAISAMKTLKHRFPKDFWDKILKAMS